MSWPGFVSPWVTGSSLGRAWITPGSRLGPRCHCLGRAWSCIHWHRLAPGPLQEESLRGVQTHEREASHWPRSANATHRPRGAFRFSPWLLPRPSSLSSGTAQAAQRRCGLLPLGAARALRYYHDMRVPRRTWSHTHQHTLLVAPFRVACLFFTDSPLCGTPQLSRCKKAWTTQRGTTDHLE